MRIIPAIDIIEGKCVRLSMGDYTTKIIYNEDPLEVAKSFEAAGISFLHLVDLDGARSKHVVNYKSLEEIATKTRLKIDFGGGIKTNEDLNIVFNSGASQITGGSIAVSDPELFESWLAKFGKDKIILGADAINGKIATSGWEKKSNLNLDSFILEYLKKGIEYVISTDITKDGMLDGPAFELYENLINAAHKQKSAFKLIASGGVAEFDDLPKLREIGCEGVIIGKAIYENRITLKQLENFIVNGK